ncbi:type 4a pilus biogenesis protein PilO [Actimicrobium sp. CCI2.3]|uniref:type 4a pilus biogenesis protein PilO n=1 Tax=Actimicrobium sp. CCI2.3 TaxID=3048616 RepID=UPI002AB48B27|nr:type 4a pilus biogenesis protein PilO [Actimicrobium sp. CCI2.3]MDY7573333.1 type 4a pilus biogenesis protein PilO [Actimicrobium sp. CCI2.3]MEB0021730.1 type 4a pilus biogenesis protein PilO [Actimicrobium sp. CCI2.3]
MADLKNIGASLADQFQGLNGRHPGLWPLAPRLLCGMGVLVLALVLGWFLYWSGQVEELDAGEAAELALKNDYKVKVQQSINLDGLRKQKIQVREYVATLEKQLPSKAEMDALLSDINQAGVGRGLQFELFKPGQVIVRDYYAELPIDIKVSGNYHDVGAFTSDIANLPRIVTLNNMNLVAGQAGSLTLQAIAKTFRYLDQDEILAQRKLANEKKGSKP